MNYPVLLPLFATILAIVGVLVILLLRAQDGAVTHLRRHIDLRLNVIENLILRHPPHPPRHPAKSVGFKFQPGELINMSLTAPANLKNERAYIIGNDAPDGSGMSGAPLAPGQTITVVSDDVATVDFVPDSPPRKDNEGVQSVWSGAVVIKNPPAQPDVPINVTATVLNADGTVAESIVDTVTVTAAVPGVARSIGELFEQDITGASPASSSGRR